MDPDMLKLILGLGLPAFVVFLALILYYGRRLGIVCNNEDVEYNSDRKHLEENQEEELIIFQGGEDLSIVDILDAPGEVIGKSNYGTLYRASLQRNDSIRLLRFLRPMCTVGGEEFVEVIEFVGRTRHSNLVPLLGFYSGPRGEKLLVYPFFTRGSLADFIRDGNGESRNWGTIFEITIGIAKGLEHLHTGLMKPVIHGNLKSKNILLDHNHQPCISDIGLHLLLNATTCQEMLESSDAQGYKAPELIKMREANIDTDIYSLGVIMLELITGKEPINEKAASDEEYYLPNYLRSAVLGRRISDLYHPDILLSSNANNDDSAVTEERVLKLFQLAMACCSPSPSLRPNIKQVIRKLEEIGK